MRAGLNEVDAEMLAFTRSNGFDVSRYQLERWRQQGMLPRSRVIKGGQLAFPDMPPDDLGLLLILLAEASTRGRPWQLVGTYILWAGALEHYYPSPNTDGPNEDMAKESAEPRPAAPTGPAPHAALTDAALQGMAHYAFSAGRRAMQRAVDEAKSQLTSPRRSSDEELEDIISDAGCRFRSSALGASFARERLEWLRYVHNYFPLTQEQPPSRRPRSDAELKVMAQESVDWMVADSGLAGRFNRKQRNLAQFGQSHRPRHIKSYERFPLYPEIYNCCQTLTNDEVLDKIEHLHKFSLLGDLLRQFESDPGGFFRSLIWRITLDRLADWEDLPYEAASAKVSQHILER